MDSSTGPHHEFGISGAPTRDAQVHSRPPAAWAVALQAACDQIAGIRGNGRRGDSGAAAAESHAHFGAASATARDALVLARAPAAVTCAILGAQDRRTGVAKVSARHAREFISVRAPTTDACVHARAPAAASTTIICARDSSARVCQRRSGRRGREADTHQQLGAGGSTACLTSVGVAAPAAGTIAVTRAHDGDARRWRRCVGGGVRGTNAH